MPDVIEQITAKQKKSAVVNVKSGDTVRVHQKVREGSKERVQVFEGLVIKTSRKNSLTSTFSVRRIASGVGVEKTYLIHSPSILKIEVVRRGKVRRNRLNYMRRLTGKSARLSSVEFDRDAVNAIVDEAAEAEEEKLKEETAAAAEEAAAAKEAEAEKTEGQPKDKPVAEKPEPEQNQSSK